MKKFIYLLFLLLLTGCGIAKETTKLKEITNNKFKSNNIIVYYFHGTQRCSNCIKIEKYTKEALQEDFAKEFEACYFSENPDYIIDAMQTDQDANTLFIKDQKDDPQHPKILNFIWDDLNKKYILIHIIEGTSWRVYKRAT